MSYQSEAEMEALVRAFEACEIGKDDFKHRDHLAVAVWYVHKLGKDEALKRMRLGLKRFLDHHQVDPNKYSEEITTFWIDRVAERLEGPGPATPLHEKCNSIVASPDFKHESRG
jgi:hypothetical protein